MIMIIILILILIMPHQVNPKQLHGILHWVSCHHQATDSAAAEKLPQQPPHPGANTFRTWGCLGTLCCVHLVPMNIQSKEKHGVTSW